MTPSNKMEYHSQLPSVKQKKIRSPNSTRVFGFTFFDEDIGTVIVKPSSRFYRPCILELGQRCVSTMDLGVDMKKV